MRTIFILLCLTLFIHPSFSQVSDAEARAAYLLAEENYGKADYPTALKYLESATKSLTRANCKILYLQIQIEKELYNRDLKIVIDAILSSTKFNGKYSTTNQTKSIIKKQENLLTIIEKFQNAPDIKSFNEEKSNEILKIKLEIKQELENNKIWLTTEEKFEKNFRNYGEFNSTLKFKLGQTLEDAKVSNSLFFKNTTRSINKECNSCQLIKSKEYPFDNIYVKENIIVGFRNEIKEYNKVDFLNISEYNALILKHVEEFDFSGLDVSGTDSNNDNINVNQYTWQILGEPKIVKIALEQSSRSVIKYSGKLVEYIFLDL